VPGSVSGHLELSAPRSSSSFSYDYLPDALRPDRLAGLDLPASVWRGADQGWITELIREGRYGCETCQMQREVRGAGSSPSDVAGWAGFRRASAGPPGPRIWHSRHMDEYELHGQVVEDIEMSAARAFARSQGLHGGRRLGVG